MQTLAVPACGEGVKTATVVRWLKSVGAGFKAGDVLVQLEVEQGLVELSAKADGKLVEIYAPVGQTLVIGGELGQISAEGEAVAHDVKQAENVPAVKGAVTGGIPILMPQAGNSMEEGTILKWRVKVGDQISVGQVIAEIETDKATIEMEATEAGRLAQIVAEVGAVVPVKEPIAFLGEGAGVVSKKEEKVAASGNVGRQDAGVPAVAVPGAGVGAGAVPILMPQAGNSMEEGTILKWRVAEGDRIVVGQVICEVETDKATIEVEATDAGRVAKIVAPAGTVVPVKEPMAYLSEGAVDVATMGVVTKNAKSSESVQTNAVVAGTTAVVTQSTGILDEGGRIKASPAAKKLAAASGIDLRTVAVGSGPGGRILSTDVSTGTKVGVVTGRPAVSTATGTAGGKHGDVVRRPLSKMRKAIASNLQMSKQTVPHWYIRLTINAEPLFAFYKAQKPATGCTLNDVILLAVGKVVGEFPLFRSHLEGNEILETQAAHIGVAVGVEDGLVVPVVLGVDKLTLAGLAKESKRVVENARLGKLENIGRAVFTISNLGMFGIEEFAAIINPPESGILAISAVRESVVVKDGAIRAARVMTVTLSSDHRVVDGTVAAQFMARLRVLLEQPELIVG